MFRDSLPYDLLPPDDVRSVQTQRPELEDASFPMVAWRDLEQTMGPWGQRRERPIAEVESYAGPGGLTSGSSSPAASGRASGP